MSEGVDMAVSVALAFVCFVIGLWVGSWAAINSFQKEAIQHNAAHYDQATAEFKWNSPAVEVVK